MSEAGILTRVNDLLQGPSVCRGTIDRVTLSVVNVDGEVNSTRQDEMSKSVRCAILLAVIFPYFSSRRWRINEVADA